MRNHPGTLSRGFVLLGSSILLAVAGCSRPADPVADAPPAAPYVAATDMKQLMSWVMDPSADVVWASVGTIITEGGQEQFAPRTDEEWTAIRNAAAVVAESGNLLMMPGRAVNQEDWMAKSRALIDTATIVIRAAEAKDAEALFTAGSDMYLACSACHAGYVFGGPAGTQMPTD